MPAVTLALCAALLGGGFAATSFSDGAIAFADEATSGQQAANDTQAQEGAAAANGAAAADAAASAAANGAAAADAAASAAADGAAASAADAAPAGATSVDASNENYVDPAQTADNSFIYDTTIASLAQEASFHNGQIVQVLGEVVGDRIAADDGHYWITIEAIESNDSSSISAYVTASQAEKIDTYGRYGVRGTHVQARGEYHQACNEHDGLADIHVTSLEIAQPGLASPDAFVLREFLPGIVLVVVGLALVVLFRIVRERLR